MMTVVIVGYALLALTIVATVILAARRPEPKPPVGILPDPITFRRETGSPASSRNGTTPSLKLGNAINGGTEVLVFEA